MVPPAIEEVAGDSCRSWRSRGWRWADRARRPATSMMDTPSPSMPVRDRRATPRPLRTRPRAVSSSAASNAILRTIPALANARSAMVRFPHPMGKSTNVSSARSSRVTEDAPARRWRRGRRRTTALRPGRCSRTLVGACAAPTNARSSSSSDHGGQVIGRSPWRCAELEGDQRMGRHETGPGSPAGR